MTVFQAIVLLQLALATEFNDFNYDEQKPNNNNNKKERRKKTTYEYCKFASF